MKLTIKELLAQNNLVLAPESQASEALKKFVSVSVSQASGGSRPAGWGGTKGLAVVKLLATAPALSAADIAKRVGCSVARVGEVKIALKLDELTPADALAAAGEPAPKKHASRPLAVVTEPQPEPEPAKPEPEAGKIHWVDTATNLPPTPPRRTRRARKTIAEVAAEVKASNTPHEPEV